MKDNFYKNNILLITPEDIKFNFDGIDYMSGDLKTLFTSITKQTMIEGTFYSKILIVKNKDIFRDSVKLVDIIKLVLDTNVGFKDIYFKNVIHDGEPQNCTVDDSIILCNCWSFPYVCNSYRRSNNMYEDCYSHRLTLKSL